MIENTIYKEFIDKISELSDGIYPIITDLDNDLSYVPDKTADFFGFEAGEHTCFFEQLSSCVNDVDLPEYKQEIRYRLNGEKPDDIFYVRMGKHTKEYMMGFYSDILPVMTDTATMSSCSETKIPFRISTHIHIFTVSQSLKETSTAISWKTGL